MQTASNASVNELEQQIDHLKEQLAQARRTAALGQLMGTTTHEFNNVLMTIINYAKIGLRHKDDPTREKAFDKILAAGMRASKITNCVLGMARNRSDSLEPTNLAELVQNSLVLLEREMNKYRVSVETEFAESPDVLANGNQLQQVLMNLMINARQAMPSGGRLIIRVVHDAERNAVDLVVRDTGKGISPEHLKRIFDPYFSTKAGPDATGKGGAGIGLSTCKEIIEAHRGRIRVESTPGVGTAFTIKLPAVKRAAVSSTPRSKRPSTTRATEPAV